MKYDDACEPIRYNDSRRLNAYVFVMMGFDGNCVYSTKIYQSLDKTTGLIFVDIQKPITTYFYVLGSIQMLPIPI